MKKIFFKLHLFLIIAVIGCKKEHYYTSGNNATINVINGIPNMPVLIKMNGMINNSGANYAGGNQAKISFGSNLFFYSQAQNIDMTALNGADSSSLVTKNIDLEKGRIYTMLLAGMAPDVEAVVIDDTNIPQVDPNKIPSDGDSIIYIRFINLSPNVQPIDVNIQGAASNEVNGLAFKHASVFKTYPGKVAKFFSPGNGYSTITFEFKENGSVLRTFQLFVTAANRFKNLALVLTGMKNPAAGKPGLNVTQVNYYQ